MARACWGRLESLSGSNARIDLAGAEFTIGRANGHNVDGVKFTCAHVIENPAVSKFVSLVHCVIRQVGNRYTLASNSSNGTFLNGTQVEKNAEPVDLNDRDVISLITKQEAALKRFKEAAIVYQFFGTEAVRMPPPSFASAEAAESDNVVCRTKSSEGRAIANHYIVEKKLLGEGQFGKVYACTDIATKTKSLAVKQIKKTRTLGRLTQTTKNLAKEVSIMKTLRHKNIVNVVDVFETHEQLSIVMERVAGAAADGKAELFDYILDKGRLEESESIQLVEQILHAVAYLHGKNIVHRDLKPENVLVEETGAGRCPAVKVADFGTAKALDSQRKAQTYCGTPQYLAPEVHEAQGGRSGQTYGYPCDMWSIGVIVCVGARRAGVAAGHPRKEFDGG
jgi:tRNA A-37 threonylcarbamoyl transferase component Bud32